MARNGKKRNQQRRSRQPPTKRQKHEHRDATASSETSMDVTKITDVNFDCLEKIFDRLDFDDFFNVALSNKTLQVNAVSAFKRKFRVENIVLDPSAYRNRVFANKIVIGGLKSCLQFVRCFGSEIITNLGIRKGTNHHLNQYIEKYCAKKLTEICFVNGSLRVNSFQRSAKFSKVDAASVRNVKLRNSLPRLAKWFPNINSLLFAYTTRNDYNSNDERIKAVTFPKLKHLKISSKQQEKYSVLLRTNPQLQTIELNVVGQRMAMKRLLDIINSNGSISKLKVSHDHGYHSVRVYAKDSKRLVSEHPSLIEVDLPQHKFNTNAAMILIRQLNALKMFRFEANDQSEYDDIVKQLDNTEWRHEQKQNISSGSRLFLKLSR